MFIMEKQNINAIVNFVKHLVMFYLNLQKHGILLMKKIKKSLLQKLKIMIY